MITCKFGGTAITPQNLHCIRQFIQIPCCVVVSAVGKEHPADQKVTDLLRAHYFGDATAWGKIEDKYKRLAQQNGICVDVDKLLFQAKANCGKSLPGCLSVGEEMAAKLVAAFLGCPYIEAEQCVRFDGKLQLRQTLFNLKSAFKGNSLAVMGGFYGGSAGGRQVFSRGGGDVSGSLCALATNSYIYQNFTDVNGVCQCNPKIVSAKTLANLSYNQMYLLAKSGAEVLHPDAVRLAQRRGLPIVVRNYLKPVAPATVVSNLPCTLPFLSVTQHPAKGGYLATVLHRKSFAEVCACLQHLASEQGKFVKWCKVNDSHVQIFSQTDLLKQIYLAFV